MSKEIKICGNNFNCNYGIKHIKKIINLLIERFNKEPKDRENNELIAGLTFVLLNDFDGTLEQYANIHEDIDKTIENINKLNKFLESE